MQRASILAVGLLTLAGCKRGVCEQDHLTMGPMSALWAAHKDLIPETATVCGCRQNAGGASRQQDVLIDFASDDNPWVTVVKHLESKGYERTGQSVESREIQRATMSKGDEVVEVETFLRKGRMEATLSLRSKACTHIRAKDGTACRDKDIIACDEATDQVAAVKQTCPGHCLVKGPTTECRP